MPALLAGRRRPIARGALLTAIVVLLGVLVVLPAWRRPHRTAGPDVTDLHEGWTLRGVRHTRWQGTTPGLAVSAREVHVERSRVGPFRVGFARAVVAEDVHIDLETTTAPRRPSSAPGQRAVHGSLPAAVTSMRVHGLHLRLQGHGTDRLELHAGRCEATLLGAGRIVCDRTVRLRGPGFAHAVDALAYDPTGRRFAATRGTTADDAALDAANAVLARMKAPDLDALRTGLAPLL